MDLTTIVTSGALSVVLSGALVFLLRTWITERLKGSIGHEYAVLLERAKHDLRVEHELALERLRAIHAEHSAIRAAGLASFADAHHTAHERRLSAIDVLWGEVVRVRKTVLPVVSVFDMYPASVYPRLRHEPKIAPLVRFRFEDAAEKLMAGGRPVEAVRPFLDPYLYALFFAYRALPGRIAFHIQDSDDPWWRDPGVRDLLAQVVDASDLKTMQDLESGQYAWFCERLENRILERATNTISGKDASEASLQQASRILAQVELLQRPKPDPLPN